MCLVEGLLFCAHGRDGGRIFVGDNDVSGSEKLFHVLALLQNAPSF